MWKESVSKYQLILVFVGLSILSFFTYKDTYQLFPMGMHSWPQSDHYALTIGFTENGFNFFLPETKVLNPEFPNFTPPPDPQGITSTDFPLYHYTAALIMWITGTNSPIINRLLVLAFGMVALLYIYRLSLLLFQKAIVAIITVLFAWSSPVYLFYQYNFLPSIPALCFSLMGLYYYFKWKQASASLLLLPAILFLTLGALVRTPFVLVLFCCIVQLSLKNSFPGKRRALCWFAGGVLIIIAYFSYNSYLRAAHNSIFLGHLLSDNPWNYLQSMSRYIWQWKFHYLTKYHYLAILGLGVLLYAKRKNLIKIPKQASGWFLCLMLLVAGLIYSYAMLHGFRHHDYYFLDSFFLPVILGFTLLVGFVNEVFEKKWLVSGWTAVIILLAMFSGVKNLKERYKPQLSKIQVMTDAYKGLKEDLVAWGIPLNAKLLVLEAHAPNIPLLLADRKGYALQRVSSDFLQKALHWDYDYITVEKTQALPAINRRYPWLMNKLEKVNESSGVILFSKVK